MARPDRKLDLGVMVKVGDKVAAGGFAVEQNCLETAQPGFINQTGAIIVNKITIIVG